MQSWIDNKCNRCFSLRMRCIVVALNFNIQNTPYANENRILLMGNTVKMAGGWHVFKLTTTLCSGLKHLVIKYLEITRVFYKGFLVEILNISPLGNFQLKHIGIHLTINQLRVHVPTCDRPWFVLLFGKFDFLLNWIFVKTGTV